MIPRRQRNLGSAGVTATAYGAGTTDQIAPDRYTPRRDVSAVPHQAGYAAKRCPVRVQLDCFPPPDVEPVAYDEATRARMERGNEFEAGVFTALLEAAGDRAVLLDRTVIAGPSDRERATEVAMAEGRELILGGRLPTDDHGRRVGEPDILVRHELRDQRWTYLPVDVKHHLTLDPRDRAEPALISRLDTPALKTAASDGRWQARRRKDDLLQLAHYSRMLEATDRHSLRRFGGIIGPEMVIVWADLEAQAFTQTWRRKAGDKESAMEAYDFEFSFRLDVLASVGAGEPSPVEPMWCSECRACPWQDLCVPQMVSADSVSLVPNSTYQQWHSLRRAGIRTRSQLARLADPWLDLQACLSADELNQLLEWADHANPSAGVEELWKKESKKRRALRDLQIRTAAEVAGAPSWVRELALRRVGSIRALVDSARVTALGGGQPHLCRGSKGLAVTRADVEIDIDMENDLGQRAYLWGALDGGEYRAFVSWEPDGAEAAVAAFVSMWDWLRGRLAGAEQAGRSVAVYCWSAGAENRALADGARLAASQLGRPELVAEVGEFISSPLWIDLCAEFGKALVVGDGVGLKTVGGLAGFTWRDATPGGDPSMLWHAEAIDSATTPARRAELRERLLAYNEDDVRATATVRNWMATTSFAPMEELDRKALL